MSTCFNTLFKMYKFAKFLHKNVNYKKKFYSINPGYYLCQPISFVVKSPYHFQFEK
jgi:hypothetical protein